MRSKIPPQIQQIMKLINKYGVAVPAVAPSPDTPGWSYTVGLTFHNLPELIIHDVHTQHAKNYLNYAASQLTARVWPRTLPIGAATVFMHDNTSWQMVPTSLEGEPNGNYRLTFVRYLFGDNEPHQPYAMRLLPPPHLAVPPFTPWEQHESCEFC